MDNKHNHDEHEKYDKHSNHEGHDHHSEHENHEEHEDHSAHENHDDHSNHHGHHEKHNEHEGHEHHIDHSNHDDHSEHAQHENHSGHHMDHGSHEDHSGHHMDHSSHDKHDNHEGHGDHGGHGGHHGHHGHGDFKQIFFRSLPIGVAIMLLAPFMGLTETGLIHFPYSDIVVAVLATILLFYGGKPFFQGAVGEFKQKNPSMMALVSLGLGVSYIYSMYAVVARYTTGDMVMDFFFEFASLVLIMLLGHWIEMEALGDAGDARESLAALLPKDAQVVNSDDSITRKPLSELQIGDIVRVQAGENIPADGQIIRGDSRINEALLTGESKPVAKQVGDDVIGGSTNGEGVLFIEVSELGEKSFISQVQTLVGEAQSQPSRAEGLASKVASWLFWIALGAAIIAFVVWMFVADLETAVTFTVTTLVIACPHALGLAIPLVISRSTSLGAQRGLLIKNREAYELTSRADVMILDKTGTLTTGEFKVLDTQVLDESFTREEIIGLLAGIEAGSSHPIAQSIIAFAEGEGVRPVSFDSNDLISGAGVAGVANGKEYQLISEKAYGQDVNVKVPVGATLSILTENGQAIATVALGDDLKPSSKELMDVLKNRGIRPIIATGDNESAAKSVAEELGVEYRANMSPQDKYDLVESFKKEGKTVIMVGDGVNDAPSLALADVGVAVGAGTQVAIDSADVVLTQSEPGDIESFIELSVKTNRKMMQNLAWGAGYNFLAIPIAAGVLAPIGITLAPAVGAILMSLSTVIVAINAMALKLDD